MSQKLCKQCQTSKPVNEFSRSSRGYYASYCKPCVAAKGKVYHRARYVPGPRPATYKLSPAVQNRYSQGATLSELSNEFNISVATLNKWQSQNRLTRAN